MKDFSLAYSQIPGNSKLFLEFLQLEAVERFYSPYHRGCSALPDLARDRQSLQFPRAEMAAALREFNLRIGNVPAGLNNAAKLSEEGVLAVVTGQQPGFLGGPALVVYKAITAVLLARKLTGAGFPAVPVFWVASEDHDFEEIRQTTFIDRDGNLLRLKLDGAQAAPLTAAQRVAGQQTHLFQRLDEFLATTDHGSQVLEWVRECYRPTASLSDAFAGLLARLLGPAGLVLLDASDPVVRRLSSRQYIRALEQAEQISESLLQRSHDLLSAGFSPQVHWKRDYTLLFYLSPAGRHAIRRSDGQFLVGGVPRSATQLIEEIGRHADRFSPSALLRPIAQDAILPSAVYVGGPAEIAYFAQVHALSEIFGRAPVIQPRLSVTLLDPRACRHLERNDLRFEDLFSSLESLCEKMVLQKLDPAVWAAWNERSRNASRELDSLFELANRVDTTLGAGWQTSRRKIDFQLDKARRKMLRAAARNNELLQLQARYLHNLVYPGGEHQERKTNFLSFYARYGPALMERLFSLSPCDKSAQIVVMQ
ncbi:MAG: bacillithiol biosynthesis cysteine-adding enzyme BshC [Acidobacteria bacterium]|nr:bacillithiol biosynthesis cysteine-adding enzyme BshC [Acidobacteriota bacterium]